MSNIYGTYLGTLLVMVVLAYPLVRVVAFATKLIN